jgi:hypothetical protein
VSQLCQSIGCVDDDDELNIGKPRRHERQAVNGAP